MRQDFQHIDRISARHATDEKPDRGHFDIAKTKFGYTVLEGSFPQRECANEKQARRAAKALARDFDRDAIELKKIERRRQAEQRAAADKANKEKAYGEALTKAIDALHHAISDLKNWASSGPEGLTAAEMKRLKQYEKAAANAEKALANATITIA